MLLPEIINIADIAEVLTWFLDLPTRFTDLPRKQIKKILIKIFFIPPSYAHHLVHVNAPHLMKEKSNGVN
jgi:hypothetical protein